MQRICAYVRELKSMDEFDLNDLNVNPILVGCIVRYIICRMISLKIGCFFVIPAIL